MVNLNKYFVDDFFFLPTYNYLPTYTLYLNFSSVKETEIISYTIGDINVGRIRDLFRGWEHM